MSDISEKQTMEFFMAGAKKAKSAARELALLNQTKSWTKIRTQLGMIERTAQKLFTDKPQTRFETLALANQINGETVH